MLELEKRNIHRNRLKSQTGTQVTLDDDFIVPDTMDDISEVILDSGLIQLEPVKVQRERITVRGKLEFHVLYRTADTGRSNPVRGRYQCAGTGGKGLCQCGLAAG